MTLRVLYASTSCGAHDRRFLQYLRDAVDIESAFVLIAPTHTHEAAKGNMVEFVDAIWTLDAGQPLKQMTVGLETIFAQFAPHVVHAGPIQAATYLAGAANAPGLTGMSWGYDLLLDAVESPDSAQRAREALARCRALIADCQTVKRAAIELGMEATRTIVLPWGVDIAQFSPDPTDRSARRRYGIPDDAIVFFTNRSWETVYRVDLVLEAFEEVSSASQCAWLMVAGEGSLVAEVKARIERSPARHRIVVTGRLDGDGMAAHYHSSDIYVSAARIDGSSVSLLEAMACGLPAVVVDHAANREWVAEGETGWRFERDDANHLAHQMMESIHHRNAWHRMGTLARKTIERRANWINNRDRIRAAYELALR